MLNNCFTNHSFFALSHIQLLSKPQYSTGETAQEAGLTAHTAVAERRPLDRHVIANAIPETAQQAAKTIRIGICKTQTTNGHEQRQRDGRGGGHA